jgi:hypothetical protein
MDNDKNLDKLLTETFLAAVCNWETIKQNEAIMDVLNMKTNSLCMQLKKAEPTMEDSVIQAQIFTILIIMMYVMAKSSVAHLDITATHNQGNTRQRREISVQIDENYSNTPIVEQSEIMQAVLFDDISDSILKSDQLD